MSGNSQTRERWAFLDLLRAIAAIAVIFEHGLERNWPAFREWSTTVFNPGQFGVTLFLLISGFIIPASLERSGSNSRFWVQRFFRLYPLYWATIGFFAAHTALTSPHDWRPPHLWQWLANMTMLQDFVRAPAVAGVFWTLTLELAFYASCSVCQWLGWLRRPDRLVLVGQIVLAVAGIGLPLAIGRRMPGGYAFLFLTMFVGSLVYRFSIREVSGRLLTAQLATLSAIALAVGYVNFDYFPRSEIAFTGPCVVTVWAAAYFVFFAGLFAREFAIPAAFTYLGRISYSLYLVHACVITVLPEHWSPLQTTGILLGATIAFASLTYHLIEDPAIRLGKRLLARRSPDESRPSLTRAA